MARLNSVDPRNSNLAPGAVRIVGGQLVEADGTAAGTYTFDVKIPAYAVILDVIVHNEALWTAGTAANLIVGLYGDSDNSVGTVIDADEIFTSASLKATDLTAGQSLAFARVGGVAGGMLSEGSSSHYLDIVDTVDRWIRFSVTPTGTVGDAGITYVYVVYGVPEIDASDFAAT